MHAERFVDEAVPEDARNEWPSEARMHAERFVDEAVPSDSDECAAPYRPPCGEDGEDGLLVVPVSGGGASGEEMLAVEGNGHLPTEGTPTARRGYSEGTQRALREHSEALRGTQRHSDILQKALRDGEGHLNLRRGPHAHEIKIWSHAANKRARAAPTPARRAHDGAEALDIRGRAHDGAAASTATAVVGVAAVARAATSSAHDR